MAPVQEILSAPEGLVVCGHESISWNEFSQAVVYASEKDTMTPMACHIGPFHREFDNLLSLHEASGLLSQPHEGLQELLELLIRLRGRRATDGRDKIYGLLGLVSSREKLGIEVDYRISIGELYRNVAAELILRSGNLDLLTFSPSWSEESNDSPDCAFLQLHDGSRLPSWSPCRDKRDRNPIPFHDSPPFITVDLDTGDIPRYPILRGPYHTLRRGYVFDEITDLTSYIPKRPISKRKMKTRIIRGFRRQSETV